MTKINIVFILLFVVSVFNESTYAYSGDKGTLLLPSGKMLVLKGKENDTGPYSVLFDGKQIYKGSADHMSLEKAFSVSNGIAVLISEQCGGSACEFLEYRFLTLTRENKVKISKPFYATDIVEFEQKGDIIILLATESVSKKIYKQITYKDGQIVKSKIIDNWTGKKGKILPISDIFKMAGKHPYEILANLDVKATIMNSLKIKEKAYSDFMDAIAVSSGAKIHDSTLIMEGMTPHQGLNSAAILQIHRNGDISMFYFNNLEEGFYYTNNSKYASSIDEVSAKAYYRLSQGNMNLHHH